MQRLRILLATVLLSITGFLAFGIKAFAAPGTTTGSIPPQACSTGTNGGGGTSGYVAAGSSGYTGAGTTTSGTGGLTTGTSSTGSSDARVKHR